MFSSSELWKQRLSLYVNELRKYGKYIFNDHLKLVLFIGIGFGAYFYQMWLSGLKENFPSSVVIGIVIGLFLASGSVQTLLKSGDRVFLLPLEVKLRRYFQQAFLYSYFMSLFPLLVGTVIVLPLYWHFYHFSSPTSMLLLVGLVLLKGWNLYISYSSLYIKESWVSKFDFLIRFLLMFGMVYFTLNLYFIGAILMVGFMVIYALFILRETKGRFFKWEKAIEEDIKKIQLFYRVANMFTDIPHLKQTVKRRKMLDVFAVKSNFQQDKLYLYLFSRTFLRSSDYLGLYIRLLAIGSIFMFVIPIPYTEILVSIFFLYLIGFQLMPMWKHHESLLWLQIYPIEEIVKQKAFKQLMNVLLISGSCLFAILSIFSSRSIFIGVAVLMCGVFFSIVFVRYYVGKRMKAEEI